MDRWTIPVARSGKYHSHINSSGRYPSSWGKFDYSHAFDPNVETVEVIHPAVIDVITKEHFPSIKKGIERGHDLLRSGGELVTSLVIEIQRVYTHPPDIELLGSNHGSTLLYNLLNDRGVKQPPLNSCWLCSTVIAIAKGIFGEGAYDRMPILADALEDAGCDDADVLAHCRGPGPHVRGCWVVDAILGKS